MSDRSGQGATPKPGRPAGRRRDPAAPRTNDEWSAATTDALIRLARREFARSGYAGTAVERIAAEANLTKGAVYYHFRSKEGLFEAVLQNVQRDLVARIEARAGLGTDPWDAIRKGCEVFLELATRDDLRQILLADAPAVLGWSKWRALDATFGLGSLKRGLVACREAGLLGADGVAPDVLAHWLSGAMNEAVFLIAESQDRAGALAEGKRALGALLSGLARKPA